MDSTQQIAIRPKMLVLGALLAVAALLSGCANTQAPMMGQRSGQTPSGTTGFGGPMMGTGTGYHARGLTCSAPSLPGQTVYVTLGDMGMTTMMGGIAPLGGHMMLRATPANLPAGQISFAVGNVGWRTHEMVILPLPSGQQAGQRLPGADGRVDEARSLGEASASCTSGSGQGITSGSVGWVTLNLPAGRYELVCNLRNHYANGMFQSFQVS